MNEYNFILYFQLETGNPEDYLDALFEAGCDDATIGTGLPGTIALDFTRYEKNAYQAITTAIENVKIAIPSAQLKEVAPDLLNTTDIAEIISNSIQATTRQVIRKYTRRQIVKNQTQFPAPVVNNSSPLWHFSDVLPWMVENKKINASNLPSVSHLLESSLEARKVNALIHQQQLARIG